MQLISIPSQDVLFSKEFILKQIDSSRINIIGVANRSEAQALYNLLSDSGIESIDMVGRKASANTVLSHLTGFKCDGDEIFFRDGRSKNIQDFNKNNIIITSHNCLNLINTQIIKGEAFSNIPKQVFEAFNQIFLGLPGSFFETVNLDNQILIQKLFNDEVFQITNTSPAHDPLHTLVINHDIHSILETTDAPRLQKITNFQDRGYGLKFFDSEYQKIINPMDNGLASRLNGNTMKICAFASPDSFTIPTTVIGVNIQYSFWYQFAFKNQKPNIKIIPGKMRIFEAESMGLSSELTTNKNLNSEIGFSPLVVEIINQYGLGDRYLADGRWLSNAREFELLVRKELIDNNESGLLFRSKLRPVSDAISYAFDNLVENMMRGSNECLFKQGRSSAPINIPGIDTLYVNTSARTANKLFGYLAEGNDIDETAFWISDILAFLEMYPQITKVVFASDRDLDIWNNFFDEQSDSNNEPVIEPPVVIEPVIEEIFEEIIEPEIVDEQEEIIEPEQEPEPIASSKPLVYGTPEYYALMNKPFDFSDVDDQPTKEELLAKKIANKSIKKLMNEHGLDVVDINHIKKDILNTASAMVSEIGIDKIDLGSAVKNVVEMFIDTPSNDEIIQEEIRAEDDIANYFPLEERDENVDEQEEEAEDSSDDDFNVDEFFSK